MSWELHDPHPPDDDIPLPTKIMIVFFIASVMAAGFLTETIYW
jgi:hypothetical protein